MDAYDGTMHFYVADPADPIIRAYEGVFPALFHPLDELPADLRAHLRVPEELFNVQTARVRPVPRHGRRRSSSATDDRWTVPAGQTSAADPPVRGVLRDHADAGRGGARVPPAPADGPDEPPEHDRVGRRAERRPELRRRPGLPLPDRHVGLRPGPDRGPDRPGPDHQRSRSRSGTSRAARSSAATSSSCRSGSRSSTSSRSTSSPRARPSRSSSGSSSRRRDSVVWGPTLGEARRPAGRGRGQRRRPRPTPSPTPTPTPGPGATPAPTPCRRPGRARCRPMSPA